jgi:hypothetical protein
MNEDWKTLWMTIFALAALSGWAIISYVVIHFIIKYW